MSSADKRIDVYISKAADFAKPILIHLRGLIHKACPDIEETIKWGMPAFYYKGPMCGMAAFKNHCAFNFWKTALMADKGKIFSNKKEKEGMGHLGKITTLEDLPADKLLIAYIKEAAQLNEDGIKLPPKAKKPEPKELLVPDYFQKALKKNKQALKTFEKFSYSHKKDYIDWITEAKREETRNKRIETAIEWMAEGKGRNWKYER